MLDVNKKTKLTVVAQQVKRKVIKMYINSLTQIKAFPK